MDAVSMNGLQGLGKLNTDIFQTGVTKKIDNTETFESMLNSAVNMLQETNSYIKKAGETEMSYAMGLTNNVLDVQVALQKAGISLQYTVAVRNAVLDAYREIMQIQF